MSGRAGSGTRSARPTRPRDGACPSPWRPFTAPVSAVLKSVRERLAAAREGRIWSQLGTRISVVLGLVTLFGLPVAVGIAFPESWWTERRIGLRADPALAVPFSDEVLLVGLDERYDERYDHPATTSKAYLARVVRALARHRPTCIALDFRFGPSDEGRPGFDAFVAAARSAADSLGVPLVYPALLGRPGGEVDVVLERPASLTGTGYSGYVSVDAPSLGPGSAAAAPVFRDVPLLTSLSGGRFAVSFPLVAVALQRDRSLLPRGRAVPYVLPDSAAADRLLAGLGLGGLSGSRRPPLVDYAGPPSARFGLAYLSSEDLLRERVGPGTPPGDAIAGRIVIVAKTTASPDGSDVVRTPFGVLRGGTSHLYAVDTLLRGGGLGRPPLAATVLLTALVFGLVAAIWTRGLVSALVLSLFAGFVYVAGCFLAFTTAGVLVPMAAPIDAGIVAALLGFVFGSTSEQRTTGTSAPPPTPLLPVLPDRPDVPAKRGAPSSQALRVLGALLVIGLLFRRGRRT